MGKKHEKVEYVTRNYIEETHPIIHCITNVVTVNDCANALLAFGASPTMAHHELEVEEVTAGCAALVCNLGATESFTAMEKACNVSRKLKHPIVLDPVGVGGSSYRRTFALRLLDAGGITCIRGNHSEIEALYYKKSTQTGVDATEQAEGVNTTDLHKIALALAQKYNTIVIISGKTDIISDGKKLYEVGNGSSLMARITGAGCMESAVLGAVLAVAHKRGINHLKSVVKTVAYLGICGEKAEQKTRKEQAGTMTFHLNFLDNMSKLNQNVIQKNEKIKKLQ